ncbi:MAG TPA: hypothetical protein VE075_00280 [Thermoanaerobaculia bacterium]|nr:hypothetical protein [Thermoanaerobaculia bacterium]
MPPVPALPPIGEVEPLNLSRRPFVNGRPVERLATILWVLGVVLLVAGVTLFMGYLTNSQTTRAKLAGLEREIEREKRDGAELKASLGKLGLDQQNREVIFLNRKIDERTFSWSLLFDRMAEVLPDQVRLLRLKPANVIERDIGLGPRPSARELKPLPVTLALNCEARDDEAVLRFVDNLFAHPAFSEPNLEGEDRLDSGVLRFNLTVQYQPNVPPAAASRPAATRLSRSLDTGVKGAVQSRRPAAATASPGAPSPAAAAPPPAASPAGAGLVRVGPPPRSLDTGVKGAVSLDPGVKGAGSLDTGVKGAVRPSSRVPPRRPYSRRPPVPPASSVPPPPRAPTGGGR